MMTFCFFINIEHTIASSLIRKKIRFEQFSCMKLVAMQSNNSLPALNFLLRHRLLHHHPLFQSHQKDHHLLHHSPGLFSENMVNNYISVVLKFSKCLRTTHNYLWGQGLGWGSVPMASQEYFHISWGTVQPSKGTWRLAAPSTAMNSDLLLEPTSGFRSFKLQSKVAIGLPAIPARG